MFKYKGDKIKLFDEGIMINSDYIPVRNNRAYAYKINKTCISASGGAQGLYDFMEKLVRDDFALIWVDAIIDGAKKIAQRQVTV